MTFCTDTWQRTAGIRAAIDDMAFLAGLADGTLPKELFDFYLTQDALYLGQYSRVLAGLAAQSIEPAESLFWTGSASQALVVESALHESRIDATGATMSPTSRAYTSYLLATLAEGCYPVAVAAVLPCYWIYQDVGQTLLGRAGDLTGHPYQDWIALYSDEEFAVSVTRARQIADHQAEISSAAVVARMHAAFEQASRYEWMFWDAGWRQEGWPV